MLGIIAATIEVALWAVVSMLVRRISKTLMSMNWFTYYWTTFIILTGFWEIVYITHSQAVTGIAEHLLQTNTHVWFNQYDFSYVLPWKFSQIFYAEYGAYADREYMIVKDGWSHMIEGSHMTIVSVFLVMALYCAIRHGLNSDHYTYSLGGAMLAQFMNSFLYMGQYGIQTHNQYSINYDSSEFPLGKVWSKRPFMYVNILWVLVPAVVTYLHLSRNNKEFDANYYSKTPSRFERLWSKCFKNKNYSINYQDETNPLLEL
jgi:hypothetical protein